MKFTVPADAGLLCRGVWTGLFREVLNIMKEDKGSRLSWDLTAELLTRLPLKLLNNCDDLQVTLSLFWSICSGRSCTVDITLMSLGFNGGDLDISTSLEKLSCSTEGHAVSESFFSEHLSGVVCLEDVDLDVCCSVCAVLQSISLLRSILNNSTVFSLSSSGGLAVSGWLLWAGWTAAGGSWGGQGKNTQNKHQWNITQNINLALTLYCKWYIKIK